MKMRITDIIRKPVNCFVEAGLLFLLFAAATAFFIVSVIVAHNDEYKENGDVEAINVGSPNHADDYMEYLSRYDVGETGSEIVVYAVDYISEKADAVGKNPFLYESDYEDAGVCLYWKNDGGLVTYQFFVTESGFYELEAVYRRSAKKHENVTVGVMIDGNYPFEAAEMIELSAIWLNETEMIRDESGNDLPPVRIKYSDWVNSLLKDMSGYIDAPYRFYLEQGSHTLTLCGINVNAVFQSFIFKGYTPPVPYAEIKPTASEISATPPLPTRNEIASNTILLQAERADFVSSSELLPVGDKTSYLISPSHPVKQRLNIMGADTWNKPGQSLTWEFSVPNDGYYRFSARVKQDINMSFPSYRRVYIDGKIPCTEFEAQEFPYGREWSGITFTDGNGEDIYLFLKAGKHTLTLEAAAGQKREILDNIAKIIEMTDFSKEGYGADERLSAYAEALGRLRAEREKTGIAPALDTLIVLLERAANCPEKAAGMANSLAKSIDEVSVWLKECEAMGLALDYVEIATTNESFFEGEADMLKQFYYDFSILINTFRIDAKNISDYLLK